MKFRVFFLFLHFFILGISQELPPNSTAQILDSVTVNSAVASADSLLAANPTTNNRVYDKKFKDQFQSKYKGEEFNYTKTKPQLTFWQKVKRKIRQFLESFLGDVTPSKSVSYSENILWFFVIVIAGFVLFFLTKFLLNKDGNLFFSKKNKKLNIANQNLHENIHEINFPESIVNFERQQDYRSAIRYQFLLVLKKLADQKIIIWNPEKTNKDYLLELKKPSLKNNFKDLIYIFDYVWYGEFVINEEKYQQLKKKFADFKI